jgi:hypothetical protein
MCLKFFTVNYLNKADSCGHMNHRSPGIVASLPYSHVVCRPQTASSVFRILVNVCTWVLILSLQLHLVIDSAFSFPFCTEDIHSQLLSLEPSTLCVGFCFNIIKPGEMDLFAQGTLVLQRRGDGGGGSGYLLIVSNKLVTRMHSVPKEVAQVLHQHKMGSVTPT